MLWHGQFRFTQYENCTVEAPVEGSNVAMPVGTCICHAVYCDRIPQTRLWYEQMKTPNMLFWLQHVEWTCQVLWLWRPISQEPWLSLQRQSSKDQMVQGNTENPQASCQELPLSGGKRYWFRNHWLIHLQSIPTAGVKRTKPKTLDRATWCIKMTPTYVMSLYLIQVQQSTPPCATQNSSEPQRYERYIADGNQHWNKEIQLMWWCARLP